MTRRINIRHAAGPREPGFVMKHLLGEYSLARSYWLHTVLLGWGFGATAAFALRRFGEEAPMRHVAIGLMVIQALAALIWLWSVAGTWMAALRRVVMGGGRLWGVLALLTLGAAMLATIREVADLRPDVEDMWAVAQGEQPTPTFELSLRPDGKVLVYTGGINEGAAAALERQIAAAPQLTTLEIDSPGGWLREGRRIAEVVRRHQLDTHVAHECFSSCTLVLLAGRQRSAERGAEVGFHRGRGIGQTRRPRTSPSTEEARLYLDAGLSQAFVDQILATPNDSIWVPTRRELLAAGVLTR